MIIPVIVALMDTIIVTALKIASPSVTGLAIKFIIRAIKLTSIMDPLEHIIQMYLIPGILLCVGFFDIVISLLANEPVTVGADFGFHFFDSAVDDFAVIWAIFL